MNLNLAKVSNVPKVSQHAKMSNVPKICQSQCAKMSNVPKISQTCLKLVKACRSDKIL